MTYIDELLVHSEPSSRDAYDTQNPCVGPGRTMTRTYIVHTNMCRLGVYSLCDVCVNVCYEILSKITITIEYDNLFNYKFRCTFIDVQRCRRIH